MPPEPSKPIRHRKHPQERAQVRRSLLISAARRLLATHALDELSLPIIAREAGIAPSSTYHFFRDLYELYGELAVVIVSEMIGLIPSDLKPGDWEDVVEAYLHYAADTFNKDPAALQLILGTRTTPQIKRAACQDNAPFGEELSLEIDRHFVLPEIEDALARSFGQSRSPTSCSACRFRRTAGSPRTCWKKADALHAPTLPSISHVTSPVVRHRTRARALVPHGYHGFPM